MDGKLKNYLCGIVDAYIELLKTGIRDICMPNVGVFDKKELDFIDVKAYKYGLRTLLVTYHRKDKKGNKFKSYQKIIYKIEARKKAIQIRRLITKTGKTKNDHTKIGRLLGYSDERIKEYLNSLEKIGKFRNFYLIEHQ